MVHLCLCASNTVAKQERRYSSSLIDRPYFNVSGIPGKYIIQLKVLYSNTDGYVRATDHISRVPYTLMYCNSFWELRSLQSSTESHVDAG
ncbi:unnamed protein product [Heterobilharzia americana]|nr:unnamed protein product [Heterobilharzia americana]